MAEARVTWVVNVALYTLGGVVSSLAMGYGLGATGHRLIPGGWRTVALAAVLATALFAAAGELGWLRFRLPEPKRQTRDIWVHRFGLRLAALLWGLDLGLTVTSRFTFAGTWVLVLTPVAMGEPWLGMAAMVAFWLARVLPVWTAPLLMADASDVPALLDAVADQHRAFYRAQLLGLGLLIAYLILAAT